MESLKSIFWANNRPTSTEDETSTENSYYPKSETETEISEPKNDPPTETLEDQIRNLELSKNELKNENRRLKLKIKRHEKNLARLTTENEAAVKERIELEDKLLSRNDQLESDIRRLENDIRRLEFQRNRYQTESKQEQLETYENEKIDLKNELLNCKSTIDRLESDNRRLETQKKKYQTESQEKQAQLETCEKEKNALIKCKVFDKLTEL